jgi:hypothetical protein
MMWNKLCVPNVVSSLKNISGSKRSLKVPERVHVSGVSKLKVHA